MNHLETFIQDLENAKKVKKDVDNKIAERIRLYEKEPYGNESEGRSKLVTGLIKRAVNWFVPNAIRPFVSASKIFSLRGATADDIQSAENNEELLNYEFMRRLPYYKILYDALHTEAKEGTVIGKTGWFYDTKTEKRSFDGLIYEEVQMILSQFPSAEAVLNDDGTYNVSYEEEIVVDEHPTLELVKNEDVIVDPKATDVDDARYIIHRIKMPLSELRKLDKKYNKNGIYENVDKLEERLYSDDGTLETERKSVYGRGYDDNIEYADRLNKPIEIYEYWGYYDIDGDGIAEPIVATFNAESRVMLRFEENPFPDKKPPFVKSNYTRIPFSFWGDGLADFLEDSQKVTTSIMRTFIDTLASSTYRTKFVEKSAVDNIAVKKMMEGKIGDVILVNSLAGVKEADSSPIPPSLFNAYEFMVAEGENESGITRYTQGLDGKSLNKTATGISAVMNASQMRIWEVTMRFSKEFLEPLGRKWLAYNKAFMTRDAVIRISDDKYVEFKKDDLEGRFDIEINIAANGINEQKSQQIIQMLQMVEPLVQTGAVPPGIVSSLVSKLFDMFDFKDIAKEIKDYGSQINQATQTGQGISGVDGVPSGAYTGEPEAFGG